MGYVLKVSCQGCQGNEDCGSGINGKSSGNIGNNGSGESCGNCVSEKLVKLGNGIKDFDGKVVEKYFKEGAPDALFDKSVMWFFNWKLGHCNRCNNIFRVPTVTFFEKDKNKIEFKETVCECGCRDITVYENESENDITCKSCGTKYHVEEIGCWD